MNQTLPSGLISVRRVGTVLAATAGISILALLPFEPTVVFGVGTGLVGSPVDVLRIITDVDNGGTLSSVFRGGMYGAIGIGVFTASVLATVAAIRSRSVESLLLSEALAMSALGIAAEFALVPLLRVRGTPEGVGYLTTLASVAVLTWSMGWMLKFLTLFPQRLDDEELERAIRGQMSAPSRSRVFGIPIGRRRPAENDVASSRRLVRLAGQWWLGPVLGVAVAIAAAINQSLGTMAFWFIFLAFLLGSYSLLRVRARGAEGEDRKKLRWIQVGFNVAAWAFVILTLVPFAFGPLMGGVGYGIYLATSFGLAPFAVYLSIVVSLFVAVFYRGVLDPTLALRRSTVIGIGAVLFVGLFGAIENLASEWIEGLFGLSGAIGPMVTGAVIAVAILPFRSFLNRISARIHPIVEDNGKADRFEPEDPPRWVPEP